MIKKIAYFIGACTDPHRNLALEEYLTDTVGEDTCSLYLWQNRHTVVIGRNQNAWAECRTAELERDGGTLARRLSGGGAVYHDMGNLNFTFSLRTQDYDLRRQQSVIVEACRSLGIPAEISGRNDILTNGCKFSGNSFYSHNGCSFHNGTLLLSVDMANLGKYLTPSKVKLESKGVASVRSRVINLTELKPDLTIDAMATAMVKAFESVYGLEAAALCEQDFDADEIERRYDRFHSEDWVYGRSVPCSFSCAKRFSSWRWKTPSARRPPSGPMRWTRSLRDRSPTRCAAAAPASAAALTAPTSPRIITVTRPAPICSLPMSVTLAAFTIASAASIAPTRPWVSTIPSAMFIFMCFFLLILF